MSALRTVSALLLLAAAATASADGSWFDEPFHLHFRLGGLSILPTGASRPVELANVSGEARLSGVNDGPIAGSSTKVGGALIAALIVGYAPPILDRQLSIETILALPFKQRLRNGGTLATTSLAHDIAGSLPTGVPALGPELGEATVLSPVVTAVYRFLPAARVRPFLGAGGCLLVVLDTKITNPVLTSVTRPTVDTPPRLGWVVQGGVEVRLARRFFLSADVKYVGGLKLTSTMKDVWVSVPGLPIYGSARLGDTVSRMQIDPLVSFLGVGMDL